ncbi:MAG: hypothetical protein IJV77_04290, partial [Clostridia bacterium]|nr:hypothetical protein [Clostridia bacterium]
SYKGAFLLMIDDETGNAKARFQAANKKAADLGVSVYHFNPDILGGFNDKVTGTGLKTSANVMDDLYSVTRSSNIKGMQENLMGLLKINETSAVTTEFKNKIAKDNEIELDSASKIKKDDYDTDPAYQAALKEAQEADKEAKAEVDDLYDDWYKEAANVAEFNEALYDANVAVLNKYNNKVLGISGGTVASRSSYVAPDAVLGADAKYVKVGNTFKVAVDPADLEVAVANIALKKPSFASFKDEDGNIIVKEAFQLSSVKTFNIFANPNYHLYNEADLGDVTGIDYTSEKTDLYVTVANYGMFAHLIENNKGDYPVFFGGAWCPNTQAIARRSNEICAQSGVTKIFFFDPRLADGATGVSAMNTRDNGDKATDKNFTYAYADFLDKYLSDYKSAWNYEVKLIIDSSKGDDKEYTKMCVPNLMLFNGSAKSVKNFIQ